MGVFKKEKATVVKPLTDYFIQREAKELFNYAVKMVSPHIFMGEIHVDTRAQATDGLFKDDKYEPIPREYKKEKIEAVTLLELSFAKGNGAAALLLGVFYEHGIGCNKDMEKARLWYSRVIDMVSCKEGEKNKFFVRVILKSCNSTFDFSSITDEPGVGSAITMTSLRMRTGELYDIISEGLGDNPEWVDELVELGYFILCHYATKKEIASMCELGVCMLQSNMIENLAVKRVFFLESEEKIMKTGEKVLNRCIALARNGDLKAQYYVKNILGMEI